ncbi:SRPBCC family protein [Nocardia sp. NPDC003345]
MEAALPKNLEVSIEIAAPPERVWAVLADPARMPEFSPQCVRMIPIGKPRAGTLTVNLNRQGWKFWPTTSRILRYEKNSALAFRVSQNRSVWVYTLEPAEGGTRLVERRDVPNGTSWFSRTMIDAALGGEAAFEEELVRGMNESLAKIKTAVEAG